MPGPRHGSGTSGRLRRWLPAIPRNTPRWQTDDFSTTWLADASRLAVPKRALNVCKLTINNP